MSDTIASSARPELGKPNVGDQVIIVECLNRGTRDIDATITKVARLFVTVTEALPEDHPRFQRPREWKMRMESQRVDSKYSYADSFVTPEQRAWDVRHGAASAYLFEAGLQINTAKIPYNDRAALALKVSNLLRVADGLDPL